MPDDLPMRPSSQPCRTCAHWKRFCSWYLGYSLKGEELHCDWEPSRYQALRPKAEEERDA